VDIVDNSSNSPQRKARILSFSNQKGGVGKTTTTVSVSALLSSLGYKTLIIDMDPQANATTAVGIDKRTLEKTIYECLHGEIAITEAICETDYENLYLIPATVSLAGAEIELSVKDRREFILNGLMSELIHKFDFITIDCPPSLGLLTINALAASEKLIIPLQCEYLSLEGLGDLLNTFTLIQQNLNPKITIGGVILTMADFRANSTLQVIDEIKTYFEDKVFKSVVPRSIRVAEAPSHGKPIVFYDPHSKATKAYSEIVEELLIREGLKTVENSESNQEEEQKTLEEVKEI